MPFGIGIHPGSIHPSGIHPTETFHPSESKGRGGGDKPSLVIVTSEHNPFSSAASSGLPPNDAPAKSTLQKATWPNKPGDYVVKTGDTPDADGRRPVYRLDDVTGAPMRTRERAKSDEQSVMRVVSDTPAAKPAGRPTLPPAANIDPKQLGALNAKGLYSDGKGHDFGQFENRLYQVVHDRTLRGPMAVDPKRPHTFAAGVPVRLKGKGNLEPLAKAKLQGGLDPIGRKETRSLRIAEARESLAQAESRAQDMHTAWQTAVQRYDTAFAHNVRANQHLQQTSSELRESNRQLQRLNQSLSREQDPVRRDSINQQVTDTEQQISAATSVYNDAHRVLLSTERNLSAASEQVRQMSDDYVRAERDLTTARNRLNDVLRE